MTLAELHRLARIGAEARLQELEQERAAIFRAFPSLRGPASARTPDVTSDGDGSAEPRRRRRKMSREARQRIAAAQRKRWEEWRAQGNAENGEAAAVVQGGARKKR